MLIDHLFIDTYKSNNINIVVNDRTVNDSEICVRWMFSWASLVMNQSYSNTNLDLKQMTYYEQCNINSGNFA